MTQLRQAIAGRVEAEVVAGLQRIEAAEWDRLVRPGEAGLRHGFLLAWEQVELASLASRPVVVRRPGEARLLAAAAGYRYDLDMASVSHPILPGVVATVRRIWPRFLITHVFELGAPAARTDPLLVDPAADPEAAASAVVAAVVDEAEASGSTMIIVQDFVDEHGPLAAALRAHGFSSVVTLPTIVVHTEYPSFEDYLGAMRSKYRRRARCVFRDSDHLTVERLSDFAPEAAELARLWRLVYDRADETKREILTEEFFAAASELEEISALILRREDGSIAIFGLLMEDHPWLHFLQCGFAEEAGRSEAAYFRLLFEIVRVAIDDNFELAHLGCTTVGPKLDVGGLPIGLGAWIHHRNPLLQRLFVMGGNGRFAPRPVSPRRVFAASGE